MNDEGVCYGVNEVGVSLKELQGRIQSLETRRRNHHLSECVVTSVYVTSTLDTNSIPSLTEMCISVVACHIDSVISFAGFPFFMAKRIMDAATDINRTLHTNQCTVKYHSYGTVSDLTWNKLLRVYGDGHLSTLSLNVGVTIEAQLMKSICYNLRNSTITSLYLDNCGLRNEALVGLCDLPGLRSLSLSRNICINDKGLVYLAEVAPSNEYILMRCKQAHQEYGIAGVDNMLHTLDCIPSLTALNLSDTHVTMKGIECVMRRFPSLSLLCTAQYHDISEPIDVSEYPSVSNLAIQMGFEVGAMPLGDFCSSVKNASSAMLRESGFSPGWHEGWLLRKWLMSRFHNAPLERRFTPKKNIEKAPVVFSRSSCAATTWRDRMLFDLSAAIQNYFNSFQKQNLKREVRERELEDVAERTVKRCRANALRKARLYIQKAAERERVAREKKTASENEKKERKINVVRNLSNHSWVEVANDVMSQSTPMFKEPCQTQYDRKMNTEGDRKQRSHVNPFRCTKKALPVTPVLSSSHIDVARSWKSPSNRNGQKTQLRQHKKILKNQSQPLITNFFNTNE